MASSSPRGIARPLSSAWRSGCVGRVVPESSVVLPPSCSLPPVGPWSLRRAVCKSPPRQSPWSFCSSPGPWQPKPPRRRGSGYGESAGRYQEPCLFLLMCREGCAGAGGISWLLLLWFGAGAGSLEGSALGHLSPLPRDPKCGSALRKPVSVSPSVLSLSSVSVSACGRGGNGGL